MRLKGGMCIAEERSGVAGPRLGIVGRASVLEKLTHLGEDSSISFAPLSVDGDRCTKG